MSIAHFILMNKDTEVLAFDYDLEEHKAVRITRIMDLQAAPIGMVDFHGGVSKRELNYWWRHRAIPASRFQVERLLENIKLESTLQLAEKSFGLSLSDRYWLNDEDEPKNWADINFFENDFSDDLGFLTLGQDSAGSSSGAPDYASINLSSPNSTLGGDLLKKWKIIDGKRVLLKAGTGFVNQEPYNELAATKLHARMMQSGEFVQYSLLEDGRRVYSACENMLGPDEELVTAWDVIRNVKQPNDMSDYQFYVKRCVDFGLDPEEVKRQLARMFAADFITANRDRHYRNFGVIRNVDTLEVIRLAPVYDSGSCLWSDREFLQVPIDFEYMAKPFKLEGMKPMEQLMLFEGYFDWFDPDMLEGYAETVAKVLGRNPNMTEQRIGIVSGEVARRIESLIRIAS